MSYRLPAHLASYGLLMLTASTNQQRAQILCAEHVSSASAVTDQVSEEVADGIVPAEAVCAEPVSSALAVTDRVSQHVSEWSKTAESSNVEPKKVSVGARYAKKKKRKKSRKKYSRAMRIRRQKLRNLRMFMMSVEVPHKPVIFRRVIPPPETSDEEAGNDIDKDDGSQQKSRKAESVTGIKICGKETR